MKEQIIKIPDTMEIKEIKDGKIILVEKEKKLTYETIAEKLFKDEVTFYLNDCGEIKQVDRINPLYISNGNNCTSEKQAEKLIAINQLMNVAIYLNSNWKPNWLNNEAKYYIQIQSNGVIFINFVVTIKGGDIYFKSKELAEQAVKILGKEIIELALCTDY